MQVKVELNGLQDVLKTLARVKKAASSKILRKAAGAASKILVKEVKARVPVDTGLTRKSIGRRVKTYRKSGTVVALVGPRTGFADPNTGHDPVKTAHLAEFGTEHSAPSPFMRPAADAASGRMVAAVSETISRELVEAAKRGEVGEGDSDIVDGGE